MVYLRLIITSAIGCVLGNFISRWFEKLGLFSKADKMVVKATDSLSKATSNAESEENK
jgi:hypothetical protein